MKLGKYFFLVYGNYADKIGSYPRKTNLETNSYWSNVARIFTSVIPQIATHLKYEQIEDVKRNHANEEILSTQLSLIPFP